ncbi:D-alanyl-D-alanine carboxypeptidase [Roseovarius gahaiensis]|uniref:D-alanyl-D-alanine carboxypeptidase n=1 Tax=Roseovarius gahaiensis TaxID=2716691 RepID=A0A967BEK6_9RHOB|nr:D-alanyl-D-alanine carboxypeptidase family protein [Roseovarius gahaiensis]NHQ75458.1 D-alanyl-D-alanine carboxypeptidase [Roseovarius gahaiensis]
MKDRSRRPIRWGLVAFATFWMMIIVPLSAAAAPYAALVMDARSGEVLHARNADTRLHPASLTKMMTLYVVFEAVENGEISLDTPVKISSHAASEPPSKLGLRSGQTIRLRYLIRAAAVKSANDAATALAEAIEGSEARFARRMNRTAKALGMTRTTFKNAHGLTERGHLSTARDMTVMGRHLFYDYPDYYNLFSRITADAGVRKVYHTNRRLLGSYRGADGIKTGYTRAAGFNLTASAERGSERIIATVFGGRSTATRNAKVAELLDMGFRRAPTRVALHRPARPPYMGKIGAGEGTPGGYGKKVRLVAAAAVKRSLRPQARRVTEPEAPVVLAAKDDIEQAILAAQNVEVVADITAEVTPEADATVATGSAQAPLPKVNPQPRPKDLVLARLEEPKPDPVQEVVTRVSTSGGRNWGINVGRYPSQYKARKILLKTALNEMSTLDGSLRKVVKRPTGFDANFMGLTRETADLACRRLQAKQITCFMIQPGGGA